jgi:hypothetical protein
MTVDMLTLSDLETMESSETRLLDPCPWGRSRWWCPTPPLGSGEAEKHLLAINQHRQAQGYLHTLWAFVGLHLWLAFRSFGMLISYVLTLTLAN